MTKRNLLLASILIPVAALVALFAVALARSGGIPGGLVVNSQFGEVSTKEKPAPDFSLITLDGEEIRLSDMRGKVVMVDFWFSWCPPCRAEAPELVEAYKKYQGPDVEFVGVAIWDVIGQVESFVKRYGVTYINGLDEKGKIAIDYGVTGIPEKYFVDKNGNIAKKFVGPITVEKLEGVLEELLAQ